MEMIPWDAIIGVIGTLLGTILGWGIAQFGRIVINIKNVDINFYRFNPPLDYIDVFSENIADGVVVRLSLAVTNRRGIPCSFTESKVVLEYQGEEVEIDRDIFINQSEENEFEKLLNINAYSAIEVSYDKSYSILPHAKKLQNGYKIYFVYKLNGKKLVHKKMICNK